MASEIPGRGVHSREALAGGEGKGGMRRRCQPARRKGIARTHSSRFGSMILRRKPPSRGAGRSSVTSQVRRNRSKAEAGLEGIVPEHLDGVERVLVQVATHQLELCQDVVGSRADATA